MRLLKGNTLLFLIVFLAFFLRILGINWDQGFHLHPDERFLTMVISAIHLPSSLGQYFNQSLSPLNPYNNGFNFYVYGTFPLLLTRLVGEIFQYTSYEQIYIVGRLLSALLDTGTVVIIYFLSQQLFNRKQIAYWASLLYAVAVFPIQQAHFFTVDSFTVFFATLTLYLFIRYVERGSKLAILATGICFGITLANKISIIITIPLFFIFIAFPYFKLYLSKKFTRHHIYSFALCSLLFLGGTVVSFRIFQPYAFEGLVKLFPLFLHNIIEANKMITGVIDYPPNVQWSHSKPLLHPALTIFLWGIGPALSMGLLLGIYRAFRQHLFFKNEKIIFITLFCLVIFFYQGLQLAKYMRYFYPIYPILMLFAGYGIDTINRSRFKIWAPILLILSLVWTISFSTIYMNLHSRVQASVWIDTHIPSGSTLTAESWDDALPLGIPKYSSQTYPVIYLELYDGESLIKWQSITDKLKQADYIVLTSNRLYDSIPKLPQRYPVTKLYYQLLLSERLGFKKIAEITSYPHIPFTHLNIKDDIAEESFTVYDHPKVLIFKKDHFNEKLLQPLLNQKLIQSSRYVNPKETNTLF